MSIHGKPTSESVGPIAFVFGTLLLVTAGSMLLPIACAAIYAEDDLFPLVESAVLIAVAGAPLRWHFRAHTALSVRQAIFAASFGWVLISAVSAIPFMLHGSIPSFCDAFFEMMSGYTTTGATILRDIEALPRGLLLWRSQTHLIGGMGFVTLAVLVLPHGTGGMRLFRAESSPGQLITKERFEARNRDAVRDIWLVYGGLNALLVVLLLAGGMSVFDALCHAFGTVSTSGYSPYNASMGHYNSAYFDWVVTIFMFLGGVSFVLFYHLYRKRFSLVLRNTELRVYFAITLLLCLSVSALLMVNDGRSLPDSLRYGFFQVVSLLTTTGFTTDDYETWPHAAQMILYVTCFVGACAGSTTSGIKIVHFVLIWKFMVAAVRKSFFQPLSVVSVRLDEHRIDHAVVHLALCYFVANIFMVLGGGIFMSIVDDMDIQTSLSSVIASLMNIGPGFGDVGPAHSFADISDPGKWFLATNMLVGRLEMFTALVLLYPSFWRR